MRSSLLKSVLLASTLAASQPALAQEPAVSAPVATPSSDVPLGKLTGQVHPSAYRLDLTVDPAQERFSGRVEIDAVLQRAASTVFIHGRDLAMHRAVATVGGKSLIGTWTQSEPTGVAALTFAAPLPAGPLTFAFEYDAAFGDGPSGLYRIKVGEDWYSWTQFQSIDARAAFPSFDEPGIKTPFTVTLRTPPGLFALSNAPLGTKSREGEYDVHRFIPTLPLPTYLVAMVAGPFVTLDGTVPPTPQRAIPLPLRIVSTKQNAGKLEYALEGSKQIVGLLENYFGDAFPYPKLDQITSPVMPGAMENAGADIYGDSLLIMDKDAPVGQQRGFGMVVSHELAHQWFGDLVTPAWWDDIWLNESFANWMGYRIGGAWRPDLNIGAGALQEGFQAMGTDALVTGRPIRQPIRTHDEIDGAFDSITYGKGGHVVAMIAAFMGDVRFRDGVRNYMAQHRYGNATSADFFGAMAKAAGDPRILPAMQSFTDQQGVPLVTFTGGNGSYSATQSRYAPLGASPKPAQWGIPLCISRAAMRQCSLLSEASAPIEIAGIGPMMPNAGGTGYYRFELPKAEWEALIAKADALPGGEALALADSLGASFEAGRASPEQLIALTRKLVRNPDSYASGAAFDALGGLAAAGFIAEPAMPAWRRFVTRLNAPLLAGYGFNPRGGAYSAEDPDKRQRRGQVVRRLAVTGRDQAMAKTLRTAAAAWLVGDHAALDPAWYGIAFGAHVDAGGMVAAKALVATALASEDPVFRPAALAAVAGSGKPEIASWLLDDLKDPRLRTSEQRGLLVQILLSPKTRDFGYGWLHSHLDEMMGSGGIFIVRSLPQALGGACSAELADNIARDFRSRFQGTSSAIELERTIEQVRNCGTLKTARAAEVTAAVAKIRR